MVSSSSSGSFFWLAGTGFSTTTAMADGATSLSSVSESESESVFDSTMPVPAGCCSGASSTISTAETELLALERVVSVLFGFSGC
jgi:hypothetical protein